MSEVPQNLFCETPDFKTVEITYVNCKPHPYCIGTKHVCHASDNFGGILCKECILDGEKYHQIFCDICKKGRGKIYLYDEHTSDKVLAIEVNENEDLNTIPGLHNYLLRVKDLAIAEGIQGFIFPRKGQKV